MLEAHFITKEKTNLVTTKKFNDVFRCLNCNKDLYFHGVTRSSTRLVDNISLYGKCLVSPDMHEECKQRIQKYKDEKRVDVYGCWSSEGDAGSCYHCNKSLILCPKEGHPNSKYWRLKNDDRDLFMCPNDCPE